MARRKRWIILFVGLCFAFLMSLAPSGVLRTMNFKPPTAAERLKAIGKTSGLSETLKAALEPDADFEPIPIPKRGDWLAEHSENGQTFDDFVRSKLRITLSGCGCAARFVLRRTFNATVTSRATDKRLTRDVLEEDPT